jgi:polysaccharide pyruvyl transferase WcaK-like protein
MVIGTKRPIRIGLLTPYTGGNLGDGAIQEAVIAHIRKRYPDADLFGFTLNPKATENLHRIPCFPLNALQFRHRTGRSGTKPEETDHEEIEKSPPGNVPNKRGIVSAVSKIFKPVNRLGQGVWYLLTELKLIWEGYRILRKADLLIVSGGGQIDDYWGGPWMQPYSLFKWGWIAKSTRTAYAFLSVGMCGLQSSLSRWFIRQALLLADYRSYRDQLSKKLLKEFSFTQNDPVVPDLAFSYEFQEGGEDVHSRSTERVVGLSPISYIPPRQPSHRTYEDHCHYLETLAAFASFLVGQKYSVVFFWSERSDQRDIKKIREMVDRETPSSFKENIRSADIETVKDLMSVLSQCDYVVASRLHSVLLAHLLSKPVLAISYDRKVATHMEDLHQTEYCLDIQGITQEDLQSRFLEMTTKKEKIVSGIAAQLGGFQGTLNRQYDQVLREPRNPHQPAGVPR